MKKKFNVGPDGRIEGLQVIGFHGEVDFAQTPARREPVFADTEGRLIGLEQPVPSTPAEAIPAVQFVWGRVGQRVDAAPPPGLFTKTEQPHAAVWGSIFVVLGETELKQAKELAAGRRAGEEGRVVGFLLWLGDMRVSFEPALTAQKIEAGAAWYCGLDEASRLYRIISRVAERQMIRASNRGDDKALYQSSWWLARAAMDDSDRYIAAVGLDRSEWRMADAYLKATFRRRPSNEIEAGLSHARGVFEDRRANALRLDVEHNHSMQSSNIREGDLGRTPFDRARSKVRGLSLVRKKAA